MRKMVRISALIAWIIFFQSNILISAGPMLKKYPWGSMQLAQGSGVVTMKLHLDPGGYNTEPVCTLPKNFTFCTFSLRGNQMHSYRVCCSPSFFKKYLSSATHSLDTGHNYRQANA